MYTSIAYDTSPTSHIQVKLVDAAAILSHPNLASACKFDADASFHISRQRVSISVLDVSTAEKRFNTTMWTSGVGWYPPIPSEEFGEAGPLAKAGASGRSRNPILVEEANRRWVALCSPDRPDGPWQILLRGTHSIHAIERIIGTATRR